MRARLIAALAVAAGLSGCADNNASIQLYKVCTFSTDCSLGSSCQAGLQGELWVDLAAANSLEIAVEMRNQLPQNGDDTAGRLNSNDARLESVEVTYDGASAPQGGAPVSATIPANGSTVAMLYGVPPPAAGPAGELSPTGTALKTAAETAGAPIRVVANIVAKGHYLGGGSFETGALKVPILVCSGCYGTAPFGYTCDNATDVVTGVCPQAGQTGEATCKPPTP